MSKPSHIYNQQLNASQYQCPNDHKFRNSHMYQIIQWASSSIICIFKGTVMSRQCHFNCPVSFVPVPSLSLVPVWRRSAGCLRDGGDGVEVVAPLCCDRDLLPNISQILQINICINNSFLWTSFRNNFSPRADDCAVTPGHVRSRFISSRRRRCHINLVIHGPGPLQKLPVRWTCRHIKGSRINQQLTALSTVKLCKLCKPHVIADANSDFTKWCVKHRETTSWTQCL